MNLFANIHKLKLIKLKEEMFSKGFRIKWLFKPFQCTRRGMQESLVQLDHRKDQEHGHQRVQGEDQEAQRK